MSVFVVPSVVGTLATSTERLRSALRSPPPDRSPAVGVLMSLVFGALVFSAVAVAVEMGLPASDVLSTFPRPTSALARVCHAVA